MTVRRVTLLAAAASLALAAPAVAAYQPADNYPELGAVLPVARAAWPGSPCAGRELVQIDPTPFISPIDGSRPLGLAWEDGTCRVDLEDSLLAQPVLLCWVVTHELGHLAGYDHSTDPSNVMYPGGHYDPCNVLAPPQAPPAAQPPADDPIQPAPPPAAQPRFLLSIRDAQTNTRRALHTRKQWRHGTHRRVRCGYTSPRIICRAAWRYRHHSYRATVTFSARGRTVSVHRKAPR